MSSIFWDETTQLVGEYEQIQDALERLLEAKTAAMGAGRPELLFELSQQEALVAQRLQNFAAVRRNLLERARRQKLSFGSLKELVESMDGGRKDAGAIGTGVIGSAERAAVLERINVAQARAARLRRQTWTHWIVTQQSLQHCGEMLEIIAHGGQRAPTYTSSLSTPTTGKGGALLNANV